MVLPLPPPPAASYLFEVDESATKLDEDVSITYHHNAAKLLLYANDAQGQIHKRPWHFYLLMSSHRIRTTTRNSHGRSNISEGHCTCR